MPSTTRRSRGLSGSPALWRCGFALFCLRACRAPSVKLPGKTAQGRAESTREEEPCTEPILRRETQEDAQRSPQPRHLHDTGAGRVAPTRQKMNAAQKRGADLSLTDDEVAFYDAAVQSMQLLALRRVGRVLGLDQLGGKPAHGCNAVLFEAAGRWRRCA